MFAVCAYRDSPYLEECIRSLKAQTVPSPVILCTSTPSRFLESMAEKYDLPYCVRDGKSGIRDDWNFAYEKADAELVTIAHQDDRYHKDYAEEVLKAYKRYPDMTVFTSDYTILKDGKEITKDTMLFVKRLLRTPLRMRKLADRRWVKLLPLRFGNPVCCPATTYQKKALGLPLVRSEYQFALDWDNLVRLAKLPGRFVCVERPLMDYRVHEGATTKACIIDHRRVREEQEMFAKFWPAPVVRLLMRGYTSAYKEYE